MMIQLIFPISTLNIYLPIIILSYSTSRCGTDTFVFRADRASAALRALQLTHPAVVLHPRHRLLKKLYHSSSTSTQRGSHRTVCFEGEHKKVPKNDCPGLHRDQL